MKVSLDEKIIIIKYNSNNYKNLINLIFKNSIGINSIQNKSKYNMTKNKNIIEYVLQ